MLPEALHYLFTPCPAWVRKMGYLRESVATNARAKRCRAAWAEHLNLCKEEITSFVNSLGKQPRIAVLGSGWQLDLPVEFLAQACKEVVLVDIIHPLPARLRGKRHGMQCVSADVTGVLEGDIFHHRWPESFSVNHLDFLGKFDGIISLNLLSQLSLLPLDWMERNRPLMDENTLTYAKHIQQAHWELLHQLAPKICLITDTEILSTKNGQTPHFEKKLVHISLPEPKASWLWTVAHLGEINAHESFIHRVAVFKL